MSHVDQIEFEEKWDLQTLQEMCQAEGWQFIENQTSYNQDPQLIGRCCHSPSFHQVMLSGMYASYYSSIFNSLYCSSSITR